MKYQKLGIERGTGKEVLRTVIVLEGEELVDQKAFWQVGFGPGANHDLIARWNSIRSLNKLGDVMWHYNLISN